MSEELPDGCMAWWLKSMWVYELHPRFETLFSVPNTIFGGAFGAFVSIHYANAENSVETGIEIIVLLVLACGFLLLTVTAGSQIARHGLKKHYLRAIGTLIWGVLLAYLANEFIDRGYIVAAILLPWLAYSVSYGMILYRVDPHMDNLPNMRQHYENE